MRLGKCPGCKTDLEEGDMRASISGGGRPTHIIIT